MASLSEFVRLLKMSSPVRRIKLLFIIIVTLLAFGGLYLSGLQTYTVPDLTRLELIEGRVAGYPDRWEHNRALIRVGVSYTLNGQRERKPVYLYHNLYIGSGLRINSKVLLVVERLAEGSRVRGLTTLNGQVLYEDRFYRQVVAWNNASIKFKLFGVLLLIMIFTVPLLVTVTRHRRELFGTP
ncbi:hypothetical protein [Pseudomonas fulva]|uniref:hypothetical protein n=1 Tax=Pseudomonas fulva TaxID=47880 RepID=UPI0018AC5739|nr:hypothetical protein [Pseudomonas fulva]MBF8774408.1 hypothetical protein [Pseudomonas fulva]